MSPMTPISHIVECTVPIRGENERERERKHKKTGKITSRQDAEVAKEEADRS